MAFLAFSLELYRTVRCPVTSGLFGLPNSSLRSLMVVTLVSIMKDPAKIITFLEKFIQTNTIKHQDLLCEASHSSAAVFSL